MSGRPGRSRASRRKRKPRLCSRLRIRTSGLVLRPRMPDIIRLRVALSTISTMIKTGVVHRLAHWTVHAWSGRSWPRTIVRFLGEQGLHVRQHDARHFAHHGHDDAVAELPIRLGVADRNPEGIGKAHQPRAFARREAARAQRFTLIDEDFGAVLVIARR